MKDVVIGVLLLSLLVMFVALGLDAYRSLRENRDRMDEQECERNRFHEMLRHVRWLVTNRNGHRDKNGKYRVH